MSAFTRTVIHKPMRPSVVVTVTPDVDSWEVDWWEWDGTSRESSSVIHSERFFKFAEAMERFTEIVIEKESAR